MGFFSTEICRLPIDRKFLVQKIVNWEDLLFFFFLFSQSTGLVTSASSRHMEPMSNSNGISLDELAGRGNFIPRPQADVKMRWFYDLYFRRKNKFTKDVGSNSQNRNFLKIIYCLGTHLLLKIISGSIFLMHM